MKEIIVAGEYTVTITGKAVGSDPELTKQATFKLILEDPCDPPNSFNAPDLIN